MCTCNILATYILHFLWINSLAVCRIKCRIKMFLVTSPIVINVPIRGLLAAETMHAIVQWLENLNIKRNMTPTFANKKHRYYANKDYSKIEVFPRSSKIGAIVQNTLYSFSSSALNFHEPNFNLRTLLHCLHFIQVTNHLSFIHIYHFDTLSLAVWQDTFHTYKNLVYDLAHHESPIAQWLERPNGIWKVMGPTPVGGSENSFSEYFDLRTLLHYCSFRYGIPQHSSFFRTVYFSEGFAY